MTVTRTQLLHSICKICTYYRDDFAVHRGHLHSNLKARVLKRRAWKWERKWRVRWKVQQGFTLTWIHLTWTAVAVAPFNHGNNSRPSDGTCPGPDHQWTTIEAKCRTYVATELHDLKLGIQSKKEKGAKGAEAASIGEHRKSTSSQAKWNVQFKIEIGICA